MSKEKSVDQMEIVGNPLLHYIKLYIVLFAFWLLISGELNAKFISIGIITMFIVARVCMPLLLIENQTRTKRYFLMDVNWLSYATYWIWLLKELIVSNIDVAMTSWKRSLPIDPVVLRFRIVLDNPVAITTLSNSITLTPGTTNLDISADNVYEIHALTASAAEGIRTGEMAKKVAKLFHEDVTFELIEEEKSCIQFI